MTAFAARFRFAADDLVEPRRLESLLPYWHVLAAIWLALFGTFSLVR